MDLEEPGIEQVREHAAHLRAMRTQLVAKINETFAAIEDVAESEGGAKYEALFKLAERMQDERDEARRKLAAASSELERLRNTSSARAAEQALSPEATTLALVYRGAGNMLREQCGAILNEPTSDRKSVQSRLLRATQAYDQRIMEL